MSPTTVLFSYLLGAIFAVGGILFILLLDERRFLFGVPYLLIGLLLIGGTHSTVRRHRARVREAERAGDEPPDPPDSAS